MSNIVYEYSIDNSPMTFSPNISTTRAMIVTILYNLEGKPITSGASSFDDVAGNIWYSDSVAWAKENNVVSGTGRNNFSPDDPISRQDLAFILTRYAQYSQLSIPQKRGINVFNDDAAIGLYAKASVDELYMATVINGRSGNIFDPKGHATRAEVATMLHQFWTFVVS